MKVYVLRYYFAHHGEDFTRSVHLTHKGALMEQCTFLLEVLMDMDWECEDEKEMKTINNITKKDDPITVRELIQHINVLERLADSAEVYSEIEAFYLEP
jgi:hypothetical protein